MHIISKQSFKYHNDVTEHCVLQFSNNQINPVMMLSSICSTWYLPVKKISESNYSIMNRQKIKWFNAHVDYMKKFLVFL